MLGGTVDHGDPQVVFLSGRTASAGGGEDCSAFVVSPHVLVTAAHCVSPAVVGPDPTFTVFLGDNALDPAQTSVATNIVKVKAAHFDPLFDPKNANFGHDIGVVVTETALSVKPLPIQHTPLPDSYVGKPLRIVGYGRTKADDLTSVNVRGEVTTTLAELDAEFVVDEDTTHTFCHGDSGGPELMMVDGVETVVGIVSARHGATATAICGGQGRGTRIDGYADSFVQPYIDENDPLPPPDLGSGADGTAPSDGGCSVARGARSAVSSSAIWLGCLAAYLTLRRRPRASAWCRDARGASR